MTYCRSICSFGAVCNKPTNARQTDRPTERQRRHNSYFLSISNSQTGSLSLPNPLKLLSGFAHKLGQLHTKTRAPYPHPHPHPTPIQFNASYAACEPPRCQWDLAKRAIVSAHSRRISKTTLSAPERFSVAREVLTNCSIESAMEKCVLAPQMQTTTNLAPNSKEYH